MAPPNLESPEERKTACVSVKGREQYPEKGITLPTHREVRALQSAYLSGVNAGRVREF